LTWQLRRTRKRELERDQRTLLLLAAGSAGGKAAQKVWRMLQDEIEGTAKKQAADEEESETPRSQEDFERMMQEE
jgi:hypothetical protein